jgi:hypothetical protein
MDMQHNSSLLCNVVINSSKNQFLVIIQNQELKTEAKNTITRGTESEAKNTKQTITKNTITRDNITIS